MISHEFSPEGLELASTKLSPLAALLLLLLGSRLFLGVHSLRALELRLA